MSLVHQPAYAPHASAVRSPALWLVGLAVLLASAVLVHAPATIFDVGDRNLDFNTHYAWAVQFAEALRHGDPYPRWMWRGHFGLGEPALLFYSPLFYYLCGILRLITSNMWEAMRIVFILSTTLTGVYGWRLLRQFTDDAHAFAGAIVLQWSPVIFMLYHWYNDFPWAVGFCALVALAYYLSRPNALRQWVDIPVSLAIAALALIHILSALMALICFSFLSLRFIRRWRWGEPFPRPVACWFISAGLGLGLAMFYLFPALDSMPLIAADVWTTKWTPWQNFAFPIFTAFAFGMRWFSFQWTMPAVVLLSIVAATLYARSQPDRSAPLNETLALMLVVAWVSLFFASELSYPLWLLDSPLRKIQFPDRFLYIGAATGVIANLLAVCDLRRRGGSRFWRVILITPLVLGVAATAVLGAKLSWIDGKPLSLATDETTPYHGLPEYHIRTQGPNWKDYYDAGGLAAECAERRLTCTTLAQTSRAQLWSVTTDGPVVLRLPLLAFPVWQMTIDGIPTPYVVDPATGLITLTIPFGAHLIAASWQRLPSEWAGLFLSDLTALILVVVALWRRFPRLAGYPIRSGIDPIRRGDRDK